jgi:plasmid stabilization system protein ParE
LSRPVRITPLAEADIASAQDEYESRDPGLGNRFVQQVRSTLTRIGQNPFQYQLVSGTHDDRRAPVRNFPWGVWYRVEPDESVVIACLAYRRDMKLVRSRASKPYPSP